MSKVLFAIAEQKKKAGKKLYLPAMNIRHQPDSCSEETESKKEATEQTASILSKHRQSASGDRSLQWISMERYKVLVAETVSVLAKISYLLYETASRLADKLEQEDRPEPQDAREVARPDTQSACESGRHN